MSEETTDSGPDLRIYLRILNRRRLVVAATVLVIVALAVAYSLAKRPVYTSSAQVLVPQQNATQDLNPSTAGQAPAAVNLQRDLSDDQQFAEGGLVKAAAEKTLGYKAKVSVGASTTADVLTFTASSTSAVNAANIANVYAHAYITQQQANQAAQYTGEVTSLQGSIARLRNKAAAEVGTQRAADESSISTLTQSLQTLQAAGNLAGTTSGTVIDTALPPTSPSSPRPVRDGVLALLVGLVLGVGLAFAVDRLDDTIKSFADIEENSGNLSVLGTIPLVDGWRRKGEGHLAIREDATSAASESYRTLRTAVQFLSLDEPKHVFAVTSGVPDEGKSTTVANLALSFARAGQRVIVVSFDFRKPKLHTFFGLSNDKGVTSVLLGRDSLRDAIQAVEGEPRLRVLPSGPVPPNPAEILALNHVVDLVDSLSSAAQIVLLDCPPVLPVTDTLLVSRLTDGMLILTRAGKTKKQDLRRTIDLLKQVQAPILGTIVNSVPHRGGYAYEYGYGYGYGYGSGKRGRKDSPSEPPHLDASAKGDFDLTRLDDDGALGETNGTVVAPGTNEPSANGAHVDEPAEPGRTR